MSGLLSAPGRRFCPRRGVCLGLLLTALAACDGVGDDARIVITEVSIEFAPGDLAVVGETLGIQAFVTDQFGIAVSGATAEWAVSAGSLTTPSSVTGQDGLASATWTLGTEAGNSSAGTGGQTISVQVQGTDGVVGSAVEVFAAVGPVATIDAVLDSDTLDVDTVVRLRVVAMADIFDNEVPDTEFGQYGIVHTPVDTTIARVDPTTGAEVDVLGVGAGTTDIIVTAAAPPGAAGKGVAFSLGAASDTVTVTVVPFISDGAFPLTQVDGGAGFTCGLSSDDTAYCWGANAAGQLGNGDFEPRVIPTPIVGLPGPVAAVSAGISHACAITSSGRVYCWGDQLWGRLGNGISNGETPFPVEPLLPAEAYPFVEVRAGTWSTCARSANGAVYCWGYDGFGLVGDGAPPEPTEPIEPFFHATPQPVDLPDGVEFASLSNPGPHICGVTEAGEAYCWGDALDGKLGIGFSLHSLEPAPVRVLPSDIMFAAIALHDQASSGLDVSGRLFGWGADSDPDPSGSGIPGIALEATPVATGQLFSSMAAGAGFHGCALTGSGDAYCWGRNLDGRLGSGDTTSTVLPVPVVAPDPAVHFRALGVGVKHTCAVRLESAEGYCWGSNEFGQLGNGTQSNEPVPFPTRVETGQLFRDGLTGHENVRVHRRAWCASLTDGMRNRVGVCRAGPL